MRCPDVCEEVVVRLASALLSGSDANVEAVQVLALQIADTPGASAVGTSPLDASYVGALTGDAFRVPACAVAPFQPTLAVLAALPGKDFLGNTAVFFCVMKGDIALALSVWPWTETHKQPHKESKPVVTPAVLQFKETFNSQ